MGNFIWAIKVNRCCIDSHLKLKRGEWKIFHFQKFMFALTLMTNNTEYRWECDYNKNRTSLSHFRFVQQQPDGDKATAWKMTKINKLKISLMPLVVFSAQGKTR